MHMSENAFSPSEKSIFQMMTGFFTSKVLAVAVELDLFTWLSKRPRDFAEIREHFGFAERPCRIFLDTLLSLNLLESQENLYGNSHLAETLLVQGRADFQGPHVRLFDNLYLACNNLKAALFENRPVSQDYTYFFHPEGKGGARYSTLMHDSSLVPAMVLPQYWDFSESRKVLDVGGGYGRLCLTLVSQHPQLETILFDLPEVCEKAEEILQSYPRGLAGRVHIHPGNFFRDDLPQGADTIVMMRIAHDWPRDRVEMLLRKAFAALPRGGRLLIYETFKDQEASPGDAALISMLLLLISPGGECRTFAEMQTLLKEVGFGRLELIPTVYFYNLVVAEKP
jgi:hypothetical protein